MYRWTGSEIPGRLSWPPAFGIGAAFRRRFRTKSDGTACPVFAGTRDSHSWCGSPSADVRQTGHGNIAPSGAASGLRGMGTRLSPRNTGATRSWYLHMPCARIHSDYAPSESRAWRHGQPPICWATSCSIGLAPPGSSSSPLPSNEDRHGAGTKVLTVAVGGLS